MLFKIWETSWSGVYKKAFLIKNNIFHINEKLFHEDTSFFIILINISKKWLILNKFLYVYDQSKSTITKNKNYEMRLEHIYRNIYYANEFIKNNTKNKMIYYDRFAYSWCNFPIKYLSDQFQKEIKNKIMLLEKDLEYERKGPLNVGYIKRNFFINLLAKIFWKIFSLCVRIIKKIFSLF